MQLFKLLLINALSLAACTSLYPESFPLQTWNFDSTTSSCSTSKTSSLIYIFPQQKHCFLCKRWAVKVNNVVNDIKHLNIHLNSLSSSDPLPTHLNSLSIKTGANPSNEIYLPRPLLILLNNCGKIQHEIDLVALPIDIDLSTHLTHLIETNERQHNEIMNNICESKSTEDISDTVNTWNTKNHSSLLNDLLGSDIFDTPNVIMIGLFDTAPSTTCNGLPALAFHTASTKWMQQEQEKNNENIENNVQFIGTFNSTAARLIYQNVTNEIWNETEEESAFEPQIIAFKRGENVLLRMPSSDLNNYLAILIHAQRALEMTPSLEFSRYTSETSRTIWSANTNVHLMVVVDEDYVNNTENVALQLKAVESIASGLPNTHFTIVSRTSSNQGILNFLDLLNHPRENLIQNAGNGSPANIVIIDRTSEHTRKYRMYPDYISKTSIQLNRNKLKAFVKAYRKGNLKPHWKSEPQIKKEEEATDIDVGLTATSGLDLSWYMNDTANNIDIILSFEASWCRTCKLYTPNLAEAATKIQQKFPNRVRFLKINLEKNEVDHILHGVSLRQQPWQYTLPLVWIPHVDRSEGAIQDNEEQKRKKAENFPWRGSRGALPINEEELTKFLLTREGYEESISPSTVIDLNEETIKEE